MSDALIQAGIWIGSLFGSLLLLRHTTWHAPAERAAEVIAEHRFSRTTGEPIATRLPGYRQPARQATPQPLTFDEHRSRPRNMRLMRKGSSLAIWIDVDRREQFLRIDATREDDEVTLRAYALRRPPHPVPVVELEAIVRPILADLVAELTRPKSERATRR